MAAAGAAEVQLTTSKTNAIDRIIGGEVPASVLTLASPEAAVGFPEIAGFKKFSSPAISALDKVALTNRRVHRDPKSGTSPPPGCAAD
jgi:hypothetical protein